jgi:hypothetical protein
MFSRCSLVIAGLCLVAGTAAAQTPTPPNRIVSTSATNPNPDPRVGLRAGLYDAQEAVWNLRVLSENRPSPKFEGITNSDLAFNGPYAIQGSYNGFQVWDITTPTAPTLKTTFLCPASQSDVSSYKNLLFVSGEGQSGRLDCGTQGDTAVVSTTRLRGLRIFDITDITAPKYIGNVQTCRGSHTHTLLVDPHDPANVYVYISGSAGVRPAAELPGCVAAAPASDSNSALFRIEVIKVPLAHPEQAAIVTSPRIFSNLVQAPRHGETVQDSIAAAQALATAKAHGAFTAVIQGQERVISSRATTPMLDSIVKARGGAGAAAATAADSAALRAALPAMMARLTAAAGPRLLTTQCHDITVYPAIGLAGGACEGYGLLIDIRDPIHPVRLDAASDSNFSYWHSATFNNDGTKILFSDEWGGGGQPKCRITDPREWGADALFTITNQKMRFQNYYKLPAPQTSNENCVAHNGSLIPIPGRDIMVQSWYQGGISVFDWTDPKHPHEIAFFDRGPVDSTKMVGAGTWSAYWYNGVIVSSEIARGLDIVELTPSKYISQNEINAAKTVHFDYLNVQGQQKFTFPPSFALARAYVDQIERADGLGAGRIAALRDELTKAEQLTGEARSTALNQMLVQLEVSARSTVASTAIMRLAGAVQELAH